MTHDEFAIWLSHHFAAFRGAHAWLNNMGQADAGDTLAAWERVLEPVELGDAKAVTDDMLAGAIEKPGHFDDTPAMVRAQASKRGAVRRRNEIISRMPIEDEYRQKRSKCPICEDSTWVSVWYGDAVKRLVLACEGGRIPDDWLGIMGVSNARGVTCSCRPELADQNRKHPRGPWIYNPAKMCLWNPNDVQAVLDWHANPPSAMTEWEYQP